jgi:hypothetical protein
MRKNILESPQSVDITKYSNVNFKNIGLGNPIADKINPSLLLDVNNAAKKANVNVSITTAVTGHKQGTRHETGHAVDIAMVDGKGFSGEKDAQKKGIYDGIMRFVRELENMGYIKNSESGNDKAVLTFGFPKHHHHIHVSRKSDSGESPQSDTRKSDEKKQQEPTSTTPTTSTTSRKSERKKQEKSGESDDKGYGGAYGFMKPFLSTLEPLEKQMQSNVDNLQTESKINNSKLLNEINHIKKIMKL